MMTNLFSIFDPSSSISSMPLNWISVPLGLVCLPYVVYVLPGRGGVAFGMMISALYNEMQLLLGSTGNKLVLMFLTLFSLIFMNNILGLVPFVFTATSHLVVTLSLTVPLWLGYFMYGWVNNTTHMLAHLVPQGTPGALMPFMVVIESISSLIRPGTLAVRLAANMIAGHLLLALMSGAISALSPSSGSMIILAQISLLTLEAAVAAIQSYVFAVLSTLYASEV